MILPVIWFIVGLLALVGGAEIMVRTVTKLAALLGISKLIIGLTIVAFGTSAPELAVSIQAGISGQTDIMIGNIIGSNISNTLLILGFVALIIPIKVNVSIIKSDAPIMIGVTLLVFFFALNGFISFWECLALSFLLVIYLLFLARQRGPYVVSPIIKPEKKPSTILGYSLAGIIGFILLIYGAQWMIDSAIIFAELAGVSELVIGLTIVAVGTSLPEVVVVLIAALKKERDIAVGSIIGSNILNLLAVLGVSGLFIDGAIPVQSVLLQFDIPVLIAASLLCIPIFYTGFRIERWEGGILLFFYLSYLFYLYLSNTGHLWLEGFTDVMLYFVLPIIGLILIIVTVLEWKKRSRFKGFKSVQSKSDS